MKLNWLLISLGAGLVGGLISYFFFQNIYVSLIAGIGVFVLVLLNNPKRFYRKAFWVLLSLLLILNRFFFEIVGNVSGIDFKVGSNEPGDIVSVALLVLAGLALILDFLQRNGKWEGILFQQKKNVNKIKEGSNNQTHQNIS